MYCIIDLKKIKDKFQKILAICEELIYNNDNRYQERKKT